MAAERDSVIKVDTNLHSYLLNLAPMDNDLSLTPSFSPVTRHRERRNRFNGFVRAGKPLKRLEIANIADTRLKPGANESQSALLIYASFNKLSIASRDESARLTLLFRRPNGGD